MNEKKIQDLIKKRDEFINNHKNKEKAQSYQNQIDQKFKEVGEYLVHVENETKERSIMIDNFNDLVCSKRLEVLAALGNENLEQLKQVSKELDDLIKKATNEIKKLSIEG